MENTPELTQLITRCRSGDRRSQRQLYQHMYNFGMSIASRYSPDLATAEEIANDAFYKMLKHIDRYKAHIPFTLWLRRIIINCGIDHYRKYQEKTIALPASRSQVARNSGAEKLESEYLLQLIQQLPGQYRIVFVLHVIEGFTHPEIAEKLKISVGTSKSNLAKARKKLQGALQVGELKSKSYGK